jgi:hypothetical protein
MTHIGGRLSGSVDLINAADADVRPGDNTGERQTKCPHCMGHFEIAL